MEKYMAKKKRVTKGKRPQSTQARQALAFRYRSKRQAG